MLHIEDLETRISRFDAQLLAGLEQEQTVLQLLQTIPGIDVIGAAMLLVEIGTDMTVFGSADRLASWVGVCPGNNESAHKLIRLKSSQFRLRVACSFGLDHFM